MPTGIEATLRRWKLFLGIVWRRIDSRIPDRLDWRTAYEIAFKILR